MPVGGVDTGHVCAEGDAGEREGRHEGEQLKHAGKYGTHRRSEPLGEEQSEDEIAQQGDGHHQADSVLGGHSFVTPLATKATSANSAIVVTTKARSAIADSWSGFREGNGLFEETAPWPDPVVR
ncbi:hypothetical protein GCM10023086_47690 [Streptomyces venetus]|uniref:Uncharacterized protein n=1 Tax=Streptomyces venetus TaxID=1701086 RepID=A0ABP8GDR0_9ACTN